MDEPDWERLVWQLRNGQCTPFVGGGAAAGLLPTGAELSHLFAERYDYPFSDRHDLPRVIEYAESVVRDRVYLREEISRLFSSSLVLQNDASRVHGTIARLPVPVYITTNFDDLLARALREQGKSPRVLTFTWWAGPNERQPDLLSDWVPSVDEPIVYHLHGHVADPGSLVLTENDYLTYLINLTEQAAANGRPSLPIPVLNAITRQPLMFIGYSLQDWTFRVLFQGLLRSVPDVNRRRHVACMLFPYLADTGKIEEAARYLRHSLESWLISVYFGTTSEFCDELRRRLEMG
ncbi:SIR2 family NAD-dependent protein deacylase [Acrocarpospora catenulata]|uniref:SIR2 family NAD-dependent protein deacylase n=1 Tax=Acrocarpospora catenulata TaxID=2836182 RepID=UPI001BD927D0|nr:SIR2 family protein [Acrocarpospora catenulata]